VSALVRSRPLSPPSELVCELNAALVPNIRERLGQDEYATLMLLKYTGHGKLIFAGGHEDLIVYRAAEKRAEIVQANGVWVGIRKDIREATVDQDLRLEPGDLLVLHTDGISEAQNGRFEQFGIHRIAEVVAKYAARPCAEILERIIGGSREWSPVQRDDMTCLVIRYAPSKN
jgi:serine phosphatase RsbU (regulator of sigma subunit)